jgi:hypothetical protein
MSFLIFVVMWCLLAAVAWPFALLLLIVLPILWLISIPFQIVAIAIAAVLALFKALLFLPARLLGHR